MISAFFIGIGLKKHGEPLKMDWPRVVGRKGRAKIGIRMHDGSSITKIKTFYDPEKYSDNSTYYGSTATTKTYIKDNRRPFLHFGPELF